MKLSRIQQKILTLLARIQPVEKQEFLDHAEALDMDIDDHTIRQEIWRLIDMGLVDLDSGWKMYMPERQYEQNHRS